MRAASLPVFFFVVVVCGAGCRIFSAALSCGDDAGCGAGEACVDGFCVAGGDVVGEGEGDDGAEGEEGEGDEGEGDEGEGDEGEGDEGEGDEGEGEGEGDGVGEGEGDEGEGDVVGEGEGEEGEGEPVDPCPPLQSDAFNGVSPLLHIAQQQPQNGATVDLDGGACVLTMGSVAGSSVAEGAHQSFTNAVFDFTLDAPAGVTQGTFPGFALIDADTSGSGVALIVEVHSAEVVMVAQNMATLQIFAASVVDLAGSGRLLLEMQVRFDTPQPTLRVNGANVVLDGLASSEINDHRPQLFLQCLQASCTPTTVSIDRLDVFGSCHP